MRVNTRNGLFANEGYGGGVFNGNTAFGGVDTPQSISGIRSLGSFQGVGGLPVMTVLPPHCKDSPGFQNEEKFIRNGEAKLKCEYCATPEGKADDFTCGGYTTHWDCMERVVNDYLWNWSGAVSKFCPKDGSNTAPRKLVEGESCNSDIAIRNVQHMVGTIADGKWGPNSQQAYDIAKSQNGNTWCDYVPGCAGQDPFGNVCGQVAVAPSPPPPLAPSAPFPEPFTVPDEEIPDTKKQSSGTGLLIVGGLVGLLALSLALSKKKKGR